MITKGARERTGLSRDFFWWWSISQPFHTSPLRQKKWPQLKKKCPNWVYKKSFFSCIELNEISQNFTKIMKFFFEWTTQQTQKVAHRQFNNDEVQKSKFLQKNLYTSFYLDSKNNTILYTHFEDFFWRGKVFLTKYRGMNLVGSAKMVPRQTSRLRQLSSLLSQTTCTLVSRVVKPDGDEPINLSTCRAGLFLKSALLITW